MITQEVLEIVSEAESQLRGDTISVRIAHATNLLLAQILIELKKGQDETSQG